MKKTIIFLILTLSGLLSAQNSPKDELMVIQNLYGHSKAEVVKQSMGLPESKSAAFDKIYKDYETQRSALGVKKMQIIEAYSANYAGLSDEKADELAKAALKNNLDLEKLYSSTYSKAKKIIGAVDAAKFIQLEVYFQTVIRAEVQDAIPFIGELDKIKKI